MKGNDCGFLHQFDKQRMPTCRFFAKYNECKEPDCPFKHSLEDVIRMEGVGTYDQFKDKKSKYSESLYTTQYNEHSITEE